MTAAPPRSEDTEYLRFIRRALRAAGRRLAAADPEDLAELIALRHELDDAIMHAVGGLRESGATWDDIARATGTSRQAAHQKWSMVGRPCAVDYDGNPIR